MHFQTRKKGGFTEAPQQWAIVFVASAELCTPNWSVLLPVVYFSELVNL